MFLCIDSRGNVYCRHVHSPFHDSCVLPLREVGSLYRTCFIELYIHTQLTERSETQAAMVWERREEIFSYYVIEI